MKRELASMTIAEILKWEIDRREEIRTAHANGLITIDMHHSLQQWVTEECMAWNRAYSLGLIKGI